MDWKAHLLFAAILSTFTFFFLFNVTDIFFLFQLIAFSLLSALIPDLDHKMSIGRKLADMVAIALAGVFAYLANSLLLFFAILGVYFLLFWLLKPSHRGITHSLAACMAFTVIVFFLSNFNMALAAFLGYFSHLLADMEIKLI